MGALALSACGGGTPSSPPPATPPPTPAATITAIGAGTLIVHPSLDARFCCALEAPVRMQETTGGTADWNFARMQLYRAGAEIERYELGATQISTAGFSRVTANMNQTRTIVFRLNSTSFDRVDITLGFSDLKDARQFTVAIPFSSFSDVALSTTPLSLPSDGTVTPGD